MMPRGAVNAWKCPDCGRLTVAIHLDDGVTPMMLACRSTDGCPGMAVSAGYPPPPIPNHVLALLAWEWAKPSTTQLKRWKREHHPMYEHCSLGGLVLRPYSDAGRVALAEVTL